MSGKRKIILIALSIGVLLLLFIWHFSNIFVYLVLATLASLVGRPLMVSLRRISVRGKYLPIQICGAITLFCLWSIFALFVGLLVPYILSEFTALAHFDYGAIVAGLDEPISQINSFLSEYNLETISPKELVQLMKTNLSDIVSEEWSVLLKDLFSWVTTIAIGFFVVSFVAFNLLTESNLFQNFIVNITESKYQENMSRVLYKSGRLLQRYVLGIIVEICIVAALIFLGVKMLDFQLGASLIIAMLATVFNIIPYIGPWIGAALASSYATITMLQNMAWGETAPIIYTLLFIIFIAQILDMVLLQPIVYANSVKAHPLEIFLLILIAGATFGVAGMMLIVPAYTIFRVIVAEFFSESNFVKTITKDMS